MSEGQESPAKIQAEKKVEKIPWKIGPRAAGFRTRLLSKFGRYGRFRPYPGPLPDTLLRSPSGYVGIAGSEDIDIICPFSSSSKEFFSGDAFVLVLYYIVILRAGKILAFFYPMGYEDHERKEPVRPSRKKVELDIVTIDGPAGAGKSTVGKMLAQRLKYLYLDTGAMYRTVALRAKEQGVSPEDEGALKRLCRGLDITFQEHKQGQRVICQGEDVTAKIREPEIGWLASAVSMKRPVRQAMVRLQRKIGAAGKVVAEGRDTGTVVFPRAKFKFFLDADLEERARRRHRELVGKGLAAEVKKVEKEMRERDEQDSFRELAPLHPAADARHIDSTGISAEEVVEKIMAVIEKASGLRGHRGDG